FENEIDDTSTVKKLNIRESGLNFFKKHGKAIIAGTLSGIVILTAGSLLKSCSTDKKDIEPTPTPTIEQPKEPVTTPVIQPLGLNANNFDEKVQKIIETNSLNDLDVKEEIIKSALLLANLDTLTPSDLNELGINEVNMQNELQNLLDYISLVETHNNSNNNSLAKHISLTNLVYDELDKAMLEELDTEYMDLMNTIQDSNLNDDEKTKTISSTLTYVEKFIVGDGQLHLTNGDYAKQNLNSGAGLLAESYAQVIGDEINNADSLFKNEYKVLINTINENTIGLDYINDLYKFEVPECLEVEQQKTLIK
ncbi:MAG: hypothetical protein RSB71_04365, partial [Bacilli bacterium]